MTEVMTARLTKELKKSLSLVAKTEHVDRSTALRKLLSTAVTQWKRDEAIKKYRTEEYSLEQAARFADMSLWKFIDVLKNQKVPLNYDLEELERDMKTLEWLKQ
jgi:predicted HTH domain antitoxin